MKWTTRYAVLLAALILALGLVALPRAGVAGMNDDVEFLQPPSDNGDPDMPGPTKYISSAYERGSEVLARVKSSVRTFLGVVIGSTRKPDTAVRSSPQRVQR